MPRLRQLAPFLIAVLALLTTVTVGAERPRLVVFITVDQLRGDMLPRFRHRFGEGGFARLLDEGVHYTDAHYKHATTFTASGHATLFTGGNPPEHGVPGNNWMDPDSARRIYCVEDERFVVIDQPATEHRGTSPRNLTSSTIGDELIVASAGASRVFSVSVKDRGAILPAGHRGKAFWYDSALGGFVTSTYYGAAYPEWVAAWNASTPADAYRDTEWTLLGRRDDYLYAAQDDRPWERGYGSLGRVFPHPIQEKADATLYQTLPYTPFGDELTLDFALALLEEEQLGRGAATDLLAVSFSCTDYVGHVFGPNSLEAEDNLLRLDRTIARLLIAVDDAVGRDGAIVVLSSDHGVDAAPEHRHAQVCVARPNADAPAVTTGRRSFIIGGPARDEPPCCDQAGRVALEPLFAEAVLALNAAGAGPDAIAGFWNPGIFLDEPALRERGVELATAERLIAERLQQRPGVARAYARTDLLTGQVAPGPITDRVLRALHPRRSPHVFVVQESSWLLYHLPDRHTAMHGSPYTYDTHVPIVIAGPGIAARTVHRRVAPSDIAPTLALLLRIEAPTGCVGLPLVEVVGTSPSQ